MIFSTVLAEPGYDSVRRQLLFEDVRVKTVFDERTLIQELVEPLARGELVLFTKLWQVPRPTLQRPFAELAMPRVAHKTIGL
jgi:hypothetical protein